ncbi:MAG: serine/threonine-protein kinase [Phycisphaerales bacterium]
MTPERHQRVKSLFAAACEMPAAERSAFLTQQCAGDDELRREVEALLGFDSDPAENLKTPVLGASLATVLGARPRKTVVPTEIPERVGPYKVLRLLGVGGMGIVYVAEQERPRRTVALKVLQRGLGSPALRRRFEHEAELLGRLRHPGIAQIYEAGTAGEGDQAFIAMELVDGRQLTDHADARKLGTRQRVELMHRVCEAIEHAHQRGIIHRDLKPANILVDDSGQPKVLDFGVARALDAEMDVTSYRTHVGQLVGTLPYMSPEQVEGDPAEIDTRSDVFALGVILYQLLTGRLPHEPTGRSLPEMARLIKDEAPPRLSTVDRALRGDLEVIVATSLEKDKRRRYQSAFDLGEDLRRYLSGEPIVAKADSAMYLLRKQLRRYRGFVAAGVLLVVGTLAFAAYAVAQSRENLRLARAADESAQQANLQRDAAIEATGAAEAARADAQRELAFSNIQRGRMSVRAGSITGAEGLLWDAFLENPDDPAAHWALWELFARYPYHATIQAHSRLVRRLALSPDERVLYSAGYDSMVRAWDTQSLEMLREFECPREVWSLAASPDGRRVAAGGPWGTIVLDAASLTPVADLPGTDARVLVFDPRSPRLYAATNTGVIRGISTDTWDIAWSRPVHTQLVYDMQQQPGGTLLASAGNDGRLILSDPALLESGDDSASRDLATNAEQLLSLAWTPDGRELAAGFTNDTTVVIDAATAQRLATLKAPCGAIRHITYTRDASRLLIAGWWNVHVWQRGDDAQPPRTDSARRPAPTQHWRRIESIPIPATLYGAAYTADTTTAYLGLESGVIRVWSIDGRPEALRIPGHSGRTVATFDPTGTRIASGDSASITRIHDARTGATLASIVGHAASRVRTVVYSRDGATLATGGGSTVSLRDPDTLAERLAIPNTYATSNSSFDLSPDGRHVAVFGQAWDVRIHAADDGSLVASIPRVPAEPISLRFDPTGRWLVCVWREQPVRIYDTATWQQAARLDIGARSPWTCAFSPDASLMALGDWTQDVSVFRAPSPDAADSDGQTWTRLWTMSGHAGLIYDVAFRPGDAATVATAAADGTVRLWDASTGRALLTLDRFDGWGANSVSFDPTGRFLLSCDSDTGEVVVWDLQRFDDAIARHVAFELERRRDTLPADAAARARDWAADVLARTSNH